MVNDVINNFSRTKMNENEGTTFLYKTNENIVFDATFQNYN